MQKGYSTSVNLGLVLSNCTQVNLKLLVQYITNENKPNSFASMLRLTK